MFRIENSTIHCSRGDGGTVKLSIPIVDVKNRIKYEDESGNVFWYDTKKEILYDSKYEESSVLLDTLNIVFYEFQIGDKVILKIYSKNGYDKDPLMVKETSVIESGKTIDIVLTGKDTTFGKPINKETIYWYDVTLNEYLTVICFDTDGAKEFIMYPAKGDEE